MKQETTQKLYMYGIMIAIMLLMAGIIRYVAHVEPVEEPIGAESTSIDIKEEHKLKAPKEKILKSKEVDWIEEKEDGTFENKGKIISYVYITDKKVNKNIKWDDDNFSNTEILETKENGAIIKAFNGDQYYKDGKDVYEIESGATTTIEAFEEQTKPDLVSRIKGLFIAQADEISQYSGAGDGRLYIADANQPSVGWDNAQDAANGTAAPTDTIWGIGVFGGATTYYNMYFLPFDTSAITAGATIVSSTVSVYNETVYNEDNDAQAYVTVVETFQASNTTLGASDWIDCGYDSGNETGGRGNIAPSVKGSPDYDLTNVTTAYWSYVLNATGRGWIKTDGDSSTCGSAVTGWTCLGIKEGHQLEDVPSADSASTGLNPRNSEYTGTASDPYILVEYTEAVTESDSGSMDVIWFD